MKVVVVTPMHPLNRFNGSSQRIAQFMRTLQDHGAAVVPIYTAQDRNAIGAEERATMERNIASEFGAGYVYPSSVPIVGGMAPHGLDDAFPEDAADDIIARIHEEEADAVVVNYVFLSGLLERLPASLYKVLDTHDKLARSHIYRQAGMEPGFFCPTEEDELRGVRRADAAIAIQENETSYFRRSGVPRTITIGHRLQRKYVSGAPFQNRIRVGFVGSNHLFNREGVKEFLNAREPRDVERRFELVFAGGICDNEEVVAHPVTRLGKLDSLDDFYKQVHVVVNPVTLGTGLKIKTVEALAYGVATVGTGVAFDGVSTSSKFHAAANSEEIWRCLDEVSEDPALVRKLANVSRSCYESYLSEIDRGYQDLIAQMGSRDGPTEQPALVDSHTFHHIVNLVEAPEESDLFLAQPVTLKSLERAKRFVEAQDETRTCVRPHFVFVKDEYVDVSDIPDRSETQLPWAISDFNGFEDMPPLPRLKDILRAPGPFAPDEFIVYTNADIALTPLFYEYVSERVREGADALVINRRTVPKSHGTAERYGAMAADIGAAHPGFDCFVFKAELLERMELSDAVVGVHLVGRVLLWNILAHARRPKFLPDVHLTFHVGDDNAGKDERRQKLVAHNARSAVEALKGIGSVEAIERIENLIPNGLKTYYEPNIWRNDIEEKQKPIFLHSMFRTGSSYIWSKLNRHRGMVCYYEPFHEVLAGMTKDRIERESRNTAAYHRNIGAASFWGNYSRLIEDGGKGVKGYTKKLAYDDYVGSGGLERERPSYLSGLIDAAGEGRPVLQFNRTGIRQGILRNEFPSARHVYLVREPRSQYASYVASWRSSDGRGFVRSDFALVDHNINAEEFNGLASLVRMPHIGLSNAVSMYKYFTSYDAVVNRYSWRELYTVYFWNWIASLIRGLEFSDIVINTSLLSEDRIYRRAVESQLLEWYIYVDFDDCQVPAKWESILEDVEYRLCEREVVARHKESLERFRGRLLENGLGWLVDRMDGSRKFSSDEEFRGFLENGVLGSADLIELGAEEREWFEFGAHEVVVRGHVDGIARGSGTSGCWKGVEPLEVEVPVRRKRDVPDGAPYVMFARIRTSAGYGGWIQLKINEESSVYVLPGVRMPIAWGCLQGGKILVKIEPVAAEAWHIWDIAVSVSK